MIFYIEHTFLLQKSLYTLRPLSYGAQTSHFLVFATLLRRKINETVSRDGKNNEIFSKCLTYAKNRF